MSLTKTFFDTIITKQNCHALLFKFRPYTPQFWHNHGIINLIIEHAAFSVTALYPSPTIWTLLHFFATHQYETINMQQLDEAQRYFWSVHVPTRQEDYAVCLAIVTRHAQTMLESLDTIHPTTIQPRYVLHL